VSKKGGGLKMTAYKGYYARIGFLDDPLNPRRPVVCRTPFHYPQDLKKKPVKGVVG
jgi:hypothetical protein